MKTSFSSRIAISGIFLIGIWIGSASPVFAQVATPSPDNLGAQTPESQITDEPRPVASLFASSDSNVFVSSPSWEDTSLITGPSSIPTSTLPAQVGEPASDSNGWAVQLTPYLWMTGFNGILKIANQTVPVSASFSDIFQRLNFGFMGVVDVRKGRFGLLLDTLYTNLSAKNTIGPTTIVARSDNKLFFIDPEAYFRIVRHARGSVDAFAGFRYWHSGNTLTITPPAVKFQKSKDWVEPILGARLRLNLSRGLFAVFRGDAGGFGAGSQISYQIFAGGGVELKKKYALLAGYRHIYVDLGSSGLLHNYTMDGLALGFGIKFGQK